MIAQRDTLSPREREVAGLVARGLMNKEIGNALHISTGVVKLHVRSMLQKLSLRTRVDLAVWYIQHGVSHKGE